MFGGESQKEGFIGLGNPGFKDEVDKVVNHPTVWDDQCAWSICCSVSSCSAEGYMVWCRPGVWYQQKRILCWFYLYRVQIAFLKAWDQIICHVFKSNSSPRICSHFLIEVLNQSWGRGGDEDFIYLGDWEINSLKQWSAKLFGTGDQFCGRKCCQGQDYIITITTL